MASSATLALNSAVKRLRVFISDGPSSMDPLYAAQDSHDRAEGRDALEREAVLSASSP
jgi:hypothetical protein